MHGFLSAGSNLGDRAAQLASGLARLERAGVRLPAVSSVWESAALDCDEPLPFLNLVARVEAGCGPRELLRLMLDAERAAGRRRDGRRNAPRSLDLDLLWVDGVTCSEPGLVLPHPRMWRRRFVLAPLAEIAPEFGLEALERSLHPQQPDVRRLGPLSAIIGASRRERSLA